MSPSEFSILALGLVLGAAIGGAVMEIFRSRPVRRREIRLTVSPNSISPRRASTLSSVDQSGGRGVIPGSPADDGWLERRLVGVHDDAGLAPAAVVRTTPAVTASAPNRTRVSTGPVEMPSRAVAVPMGASMAAIAQESHDEFSGPRVAGRPEPRRDAASAVSSPAPRPAVEPGRPGPQVAVHARPPVALPRPTISAAAVAVAIEDGGPRALDRDRGGGEPASRPAESPDPVAAQACDAERHLVEERCALAEAALEQGRLAAEALREAQRTYDALRERVERAQALADPREIRASKDAIHREFRAARAAALTSEAAENAAREWLNEINRLNTAAREAARVVENGSAELRTQLPKLDRLAVEADAARITAESAQATCREARIALAACEEQAALAASAAAAMAAEEGGSTLDDVWPTEAEAPLRSASEVAEQGGDTAVIVRILRGERPARERLIAALAGDDGESARQWQLRIAGLVDAIVARAIEAGYLDMPEEGFWGLFTHRERREIVAALSALGFRFDGLGGFADGRVPAQRDLSLAVGYAGLDRMRIRNWPQEADLASMYAGALVAGDEWLADEAGDLSLGRMVDALGARAAELAEVWNAWGRVRPALLATD